MNSIAGTSMLSRIRSAIRREETVLRLGGDGYISSMTWTADDRQLIAVLDGAGWPEIPQDDYCNSRLFVLGGAPQMATIEEEVSSLPELSLWKFLKGAAPYYAFSTLAVDGDIYQFMSTENKYGPDEKGDWGDFTDNNFTHAKLIYSPDSGRTWRNHDGSALMSWESRQSQSRENMVFFEQPEAAFAQLSFLQMGRAYRDNHDGYVYVYAPNGRTEGTMNQLVMF